jgi:hypothetical protein
MKKAMINLSFDEEKLSAIRMYMTKKDADLDTELLSQLEKLYEKYVPANVRDFIADRYTTEEPNTPKCSPK